jgi:hypothetical protein
MRFRNKKGSKRVVVGKNQKEGVAHHLRVRTTRLRSITRRKQEPRNSSEISL